MDRESEVMRMVRVVIGIPGTWQLDAIVPRILHVQTLALSA